MESVEEAGRAVTMRAKEEQRGQRVCLFLFSEKKVHRRLSFASFGVLLLAVAVLAMAVLAMVAIPTSSH